MAKSEQLSYLNSSYGALSFIEFIEFIDQYKTQYENWLPEARLFELTLPWLAATEAFMLPENSEVIVHCLYHTSKGQEPVLNIAWPLVHSINSMQLGAFEEGIVTQALVEYFPYQRIFSKTDNVYQTGISDYASYYQQRPSQLRNTIKRREKKLAKAHQYRTEIITDINAFFAAFTAYKIIYQQSWKGDEFSFGC